MKHKPGDIIKIKIIDEYYPDNVLKFCYVNRDPSKYPNLQRNLLYKILECMDKINELNEKEEKLEQYYYDRS